MPVERTAIDFGSKLKAARERKGVSLRDMATATKISSRALEELERNEIGRLPGGIFSRSFVRAYASQVGLDPEATVEDFVRQFPHESIVAGHPPSRKIEHIDSIESDRRTALVAIRLAALAIPVAIVVLYFGLADPGQNSGESASPRQPTLAAAEPAGSSVFPQAGRFTVELIANRACSVSAAIDDQSTVAVALDAGERRTFVVGRDLLLELSDPAAIDWTIDGAAGRSLTTERSVHLTIDSYKDFVAAR